MKASRKSIIHACIFVIISMSVAIASAYVEDIYTYIWHMKNPNVVLWHEYSIKVPQDLVAKKMGDKNDDLIIFSAKIPEEIYIQFFKIDRIQKRSIDFERKNMELGLKVIEMKDSITMGEQSITIKSNEIRNPGKYFEQVYLKSSDTMIMFMGKKERCYVMSEIINNMKRIQYRTI